jgi:hypothetical protein
MAKYLDNPDGYFRERRKEEQDDPVTLTATEARQGSWGKPVLYVLICGIILALIAWWGAEYYGSRIAPPVDKATTASVKRAPATTPDVNDNQPKGQPVQKSPTIQDSTKM